jgi:hypothetical protein
MYKFFCTQCDFIWNELHNNLNFARCPNCKSGDIVNDGAATEKPSNEDGHYEGDFRGLSFSHDTDSGE